MEDTVDPLRTQQQTPSRVRSAMARAAFPITRTGHARELSGRRRRAG